MEDKERDGIVMRGQRHPRAKLTEDQVVEIRASPESCAKVAKLYGVSKTLIGNIRRRSTWTHI